MKQIVKINRALIVQTAFIGDVVLTTPLIKNLKTLFPHVEIDFLTIPVSENLLDRDPNLRQLIIFDKRGRDKGLRGLLRLGRHLRKNKYDLCICPHRSFRSAVLSWYSRAGLRIGFENSTFKYIFNRRQKYNQQLHESERNLSLLSLISDNTFDRVPKIHTEENDRRVVMDKLKRCGLSEQDSVFAIAPGSVWPTKRWPLHKFSDVIARLAENKYKIVLIGGKQDSKICRELGSDKDHVYSFAGDLSLRQTKYLLTLCTGLLTNDSAPLHLGLAARIPVFAIFGSTVRGFGFAPVETNTYVIENEGLQCRPCGIHGLRKCPVKTFACMEGIQARDVVNTIEAAYAQ